LDREEAAVGLLTLEKPGSVFLRQAGVEDSLGRPLNVIVHPAEGKAVLLGVINAVGGTPRPITRLSHGTNVNRACTGTIQENLSLARNAEAQIQIAPEKSYFRSVSVPEETHRCTLLLEMHQEIIPSPKVLE